MLERKVVGAVLGLGVLAGAAVVMGRLLTRQARADIPVGPRSLPQVSSRMVDGAVYPWKGVDPDYPPAIWLPIVEDLVRTEYKRVDPRIAMKWLLLESGGVPCAIGTRGQFGPDGQPREIGLGQIYNVDDFKALGLAERGVSAATLRAYCAPNSQQRTRLLTAREMEDLVRHTLLAKIEESMRVADEAVARHGLAWSRADYWKLVKAWHALPVILSRGLPAVVKKLGRAPTNWAEFRRVLGMDELVEDTTPGSRTRGKMIPKYSRWVRSLNNCEKLASAVIAGGGGA